MSHVGVVGRVLLAGWYWLIAAFLFAPLVVLVIFGFNDSMVQTLPLSGFTTRWYRLAFSNAELTDALVRSAKIAALDGICATLLATMAAVGLSAKRLALRPAVVMIFLLPLVVPYIVLAVGLLLVLQEMGVQTTLTAVLAGHVAISLPYSLLVILPRLRSLDDSITEAARDLGAGSMGAFRLITLPLIAPALLSSFFIAFTISFDEFAIASFLAPAGTPTYPVFLYASSRTPALLPEVIAIGSIVILISIGLIALAEISRRTLERRLEGGVHRTASDPAHVPNL